MADSDEFAEAAKQLRAYGCVCDEFLPSFPDFDNRELSALPASDSVDRISALPDALLRNIVSRLLITDAACTAILSSRWRRVWLSTPLCLMDAYLRHISGTVSRVLEAHPGPFRCVHLAFSDMSTCQPQLARWLELLAAKGVEEIVFINRPPMVPFPTKLFSISTLTRLYIGLWKFPDLATLPRGTSFPNLSELGLWGMVINGADVEAVIARSPMLQTLSIQGSSKCLRIRLVSRSLRCVQICGSSIDIAVVKATLLDRLILETPRDRDNTGGLVSIGDAPRLESFGLLEPGNHVLDIRGTRILAGMKASPSMMVLHVKHLSLNVCFGKHSDVKMVPTFLRCFPNLENLHMTSRTCVYEEGSAKLILKFWQSATPTDNVKSQISVLSFGEFRGEFGEAAFLKFFFGSARNLTSATITMANQSCTSLSIDKMFSAAQQTYKKMASKGCTVVVLGSDGPEGGKPWSVKRGSDYRFQDPFSPVEWIGGE